MEQNFGREKFMKDIKNTIFVITAAEEETPTVSEFDDRDEAIKYARKMDKDEQMIAEANKDDYDPSDRNDQLEYFGPFDVPDQMDRLQKTMFSDTFYNCSIECTRGDDDGHLRYSKGVFVGAIGAIMSLQGLTLLEALRFAKLFLPRDIDKRVIPDSWKNDFDKVVEE